MKKKVEAALEERKANMRRVQSLEAEVQGEVKAALEAWKANARHVH